MSDKQTIIEKMIALQKAFIARQRDGDGNSDGGEMSADYKKQHEKLASELIDIAHRERGTSR